MTIDYQRIHKFTCTRIYHFVYSMYIDFTTDILPYTRFINKKAKTEWALDYRTCFMAFLQNDMLSLSTQTTLLVFKEYE